MGLSEFNRNMARRIMAGDPGVVCDRVEEVDQLPEEDDWYASEICYGWCGQAVVDGKEIALEYEERGNDTERVLYIRR